MITIDYKKIMIATDGSNCANLAIEKGIELSRFMGTLGKTGVDRILLGSVAGNLVRHSKIPVMVVREKACA
jgi:nucleotide-binding universal stress UspA family protein